MTPPPTMARRSGTSGRSRALALSHIRASSGQPGSRTGDDPTAITACSKSSSAPSISILFSPMNLAAPLIRLTFRLRASPPRPLVSCSTIASFLVRSCWRSTAGLPKSIPQSAICSASRITSAACNRALEGMHPSFRHTPPRLSRASTRVTLRPRSAARKAQA